MVIKCVDWYTSKKREWSNRGEVWNLKSLILVLGVLLISGSFTLLSGCSSKTSPNITTDIQISADPIANNILKSLDDNDYAGFSKDFNQTMKNTLNQTAFDKFYSQMKTAVGITSLMYLLALLRRMVPLHPIYRQYSNEPAGVMMVLVLQINNGTYEVQDWISIHRTCADSP